MSEADYLDLESVKKFNQQPQYRKCSRHLYSYRGEGDSFPFLEMIKQHVFSSDPFFNN